MCWLLLIISLNPCYSLPFPLITDRFACGCYKHISLETSLSITAHQSPHMITKCGHDLLLYVRDRTFISQCYFDQFNPVCVLLITAYTSNLGLILDYQDGLACVLLTCLYQCALHRSTFIINCSNGKRNCAQDVWCKYTHSLAHTRRLEK